LASIPVKGAGNPNPAATQGDRNMYWDYLVVETTMTAEDLGKLGADRWELVAVVSPGHFVLHYFFKRPRE
jgi:hypothetical protein